MVAGHLQEKKGYYYAVLSYRNTDGRRKTKWLSTGLPVKGNKKRAEAFLMEQRQHFVIPAADAPADPSRDELFAEYLQRWLQIARTTIAVTTYGSYSGLLRNPIDPWFRRKRITLKGLTAVDIQTFYVEQGKRVKSNTVIHYHALIYRALSYAVKTDLIPANPADKVDRPRKIVYQASFYTESEFSALFAAVSGTLIEVPVKLAAFYGLRRSEVMGLRWDAIDFEQNTLSIRHTVTGCTVDGQYQIIAADTTKTRSSHRTLPLVPPVRDMLLRLKARQEQDKRLCGTGYICFNELCDRIHPAYLSNCFSRTLAQNGLRHIRFHGLRHSSVTLLLAHGIPLKQIQEWLGHSDFATTANIYAHLDVKSKERSAAVMKEALRLDGGIGARKTARIPCVGRIAPKATKTTFTQVGKAWPLAFIRSSISAR